MTVAKPSAAAAAKKVLNAWLTERGWKPFAFQRDAWKAVAEGRSGLLHATTGAGKTYAVWLGALMSLSAFSQVGQAQAAIKKIAIPKNPKKPVAGPLTVLWITPMRALAADTLRALLPPLDALNAALNDDGTPRFKPWSAGARSGDTAAGERSAQNQRLPTVLVTTPESLSLLLARADARDVLGSVRMVVVDEWHELLGNKRGVQVQLALARLKAWNSTRLTDETPGIPFQQGPRNRLCRAAGAATPSGGRKPHAVGDCGGSIIGFAGPQAQRPPRGAAQYAQRQAWGHCPFGACRPRWVICRRQCTSCWAMTKACWCRARCRKNC